MNSMGKKRNMTIPLQRGIIYGPVNSRRLGRSLGVNLLPTDYKLCTFNCLYCQYGWTKIHGNHLPDEKAWPSVSKVVNELENVLRNINPLPAYITFSGNGEPTLHPYFPEIVGEINRLKVMYAPESKTAILSNSTTIIDSNIRDAINALDVRIMKLDCGNEQCLRRYNRPSDGIQFEEIVAGLHMIENVTIQSLFSDGPEGNSHPDDLNSWIEKMKMLVPHQVQIYTIQRGYPSNKILPLSCERLLEIEKKLGSENIPARVY
jgi:wyosine [tRNA(Phe)-imidazoG37] synthetase (radical SAM superfamily)